MELDIYSEKLKIAFEYQGGHHYFQTFKKTHANSSRHTPTNTLRKRSSVPPSSSSSSTGFRPKDHTINRNYRGFFFRQLVRDEEKRIACEAEGITLIEVPYWWDGNVASLMATIKSARPDLLTDFPLPPGAQPIPQSNEFRWEEDVLIGEQVDSQQETTPEEETKEQKKPQRLLGASCMLQLQKHLPEQSKRKKMLKITNASSAEFSHNK